MIRKPEKGNNGPGSYRLISLLFALSKAFEKSLMNKLSSILNEDECIPNYNLDLEGN